MKTEIRAMKKKEDTLVQYVWTGPRARPHPALFTWQSDGHAAALLQGDVDPSTAGVEVSDCERRRLSLS